jgi:serine protease Do
MHNKIVLAAAVLLAGLAGCVDKKNDAKSNDLTKTGNLLDPASVDIRPSPEVRYAVARVSPAVVRLDVVVEVFSRGMPQAQRSQGSGVIIDEQGHILTNFHVAGRARKVKDPETGVAKAIVDVTLSNKEHVKAELVGSDHWTDLAVLKLDLEEMKRKKISAEFAPMGDSSEISLGQPVMALGTPYGLTRTLTAGIVSNTERYFDQSSIGGYETGWFNNWIQTDAAINPGNSGGPLINLRGEVIGINTRNVNDGNNLGFAIPINVAKEVAAKILSSKNKKVERSYTGMRLQPMQDLEAFFNLPSGVLISSTERNSPAYAAGVRDQDIILEINGATVDARFPEQLAMVRKMIADTPVGGAIKIKARRGIVAATATVSEYTITTELLESIVAEEQVNRDWGLSIQDVTRAYLRNARLPMLKGVLVTGVTGGFPAEQGKIAPYDIILSIGGKPVTNVDEFDEAVKAWKKTPREIVVVVQQGVNQQIRVVRPRGE